MKARIIIAFFTAISISFATGAQEEEYSPLHGVVFESEDLAEPSLLNDASSLTLESVFILHGIGILMCVAALIVSLQNVKKILALGIDDTIDNEMVLFFYFLNILALILLVLRLSVIFLSLEESPAFGLVMLFLLNWSCSVKALSAMVAVHADKKARRYLFLCWLAPFLTTSLFVLLAGARECDFSDAVGFFYMSEHLSSDVIAFLAYVSCKAVMMNC